MEVRKHKETEMDLGQYTATEEMPLETNFPLAQKEDTFYPKLTGFIQ